MGPAQHRLLIDYRRPLRGYQEQHDTDVDPVVPKMFGIVVSRERASFVVEHAAVGHAVAISTDPDFGSRVKIGTGVIIDPRVQTYETLERFRQEPPK